MSTLYIIFALIPIMALVMSLFPELFGKSEAVAVGGFEYSLFLSKRWLFLGSILISASGVLFVFILDNLAAIEGWVAMLFLAVLLVAAAVGIVMTAFYLGYRLTVRGNTLLYKLPLKREISVSFCDISRYKIKKGKNGDNGIVIFTKSKLFIFAENTSPAFFALCKCVKAHAPHQK